jgi:hypothetical protein
MGYDYYYSGSATAGPGAPLYNFQTSYNYTLTKSVTYYIKQGATASKLLLGLPYYGREWETVSSSVPAATTGSFTTSRTYSYVKNNPATYSAAAKKWESNCYNPYYVYLSGGINRQCWIDDVYSMGRKFDMVKQRGIGGIGIWALGYDNGYNDFWQLIQDKFSTCEIKPCTDSLFDMGGPTRNYYDNESYTYSISSSSTTKIQLQFNSFATEQGYDSLFIYNGSSTAAPLMGAYTGTTSPGTVTSTGTVITVRFKSDVGITNSGFKVIYNCINITDIHSPLLATENTLMSVFPNPTNGVIELNALEELSQLRLLNSLGEIVYATENIQPKLNLSDLHMQQGVYFLEVFSGQKKQVVKIVLQ